MFVLRSVVGKKLASGVVAGVVGCVVAAGVPGMLSGSASAATASNTVLSVAQIKEVNYMPADAGWQNMWLDWNPTQINNDLGTVARLDANTVRVIIDPFTFGYPNPSAAMAGELSDFMSMAAANGLHVQLTLFDQFGNYNQTAQSTTFVQELLAPYKNDAQIPFIEIQNEIDPTNSAAMGWLQTMIPAFKAAAGSIPITVSTTGSAGVAGLEELKAATVATPLDFYDYHYYGTAGAAAATFSAAQQVASPAPLFIGEAGFGANTPTLASQQAEFYEAVDAATVSLGLPDAAPWTMFDPIAADIPVAYTAQDLMLGLYNSDGTAKPAAAVEQAFFDTGQTNTILNGGFEAVSGGMPTGWSSANGADGVFASTDAAAHGGTLSVSLAATSGSVNAQPAWTTTANLGAVSTGQQVQATVWAQGVNTTGASTISVSWFNSANTYLSNSTSVALPPGTSDWTELGVNATAPAGAAYAVINLQSYQNTGTVYFDDAALTNVGGGAAQTLCPAAVGPSLESASGIAAVTVDGCNGYLVTDKYGDVSAYGSARSFGDLAGVPLNAPIIAITATANGGGYWLLGADGGVYSFGDAGFFGSPAGTPLNAPIVSMATTPDGGGYWLVAKDGGIFAYGDAKFFGSTGALTLNQPVDGMAVGPNGDGYWLVAADGGVFAFNEAFVGSLGGSHLNDPIIGMSSDASGDGYTLVGSDGGVFSFATPFYGSLGGRSPATAIVGLATVASGDGYYMVDAAAQVFGFGSA